MGCSAGGCPTADLESYQDPPCVLPWSLGPCAGCLSPVLCPARVIEQLYRQHCLEKGKGHPPRQEAAVEDEELLLDDGMMWQEVKEWGGGLSGRRMWGWASSHVHAKASPVCASRGWA